MSWQAQHFVDLGVQISWQAQHVVNLEGQMSRQAEARNPQGKNRIKPTRLGHRLVADSDFPRTNPKRSPQKKKRNQTNPNRSPSGR